MILESLLSPGNRTGKHGQAVFDMFPSLCVCDGHHLSLPALGEGSPGRLLLLILLATLGCALQLAGRFSWYFHCGRRSSMAACRSLWELEGLRDFLGG